MVLTPTGVLVTYPAVAEAFGLKCSEPVQALRS